MKIKTSTGKICVENTSAGELVLVTSTGRITISNVNCTGDIDTTVSTGKIKLSNIMCKNFLSSGSTGDVTGTILSEKIVIVETDTGSVDVPKSIVGGRCETEYTINFGCAGKVRCSYDKNTVRLLWQYMPQPHG